MTTRFAIQRKATFRKARDGGWVFTWGHNTYKAIRNIAGFAGRDWELWRFTDSDWLQLADIVESRAECVDLAAGDLR